MIKGSSELGGVWWGGVWCSVVGWSELDAVWLGGVGCSGVEVQVGGLGGVFVD